MSGRSVQNNASHLSMGPRPGRHHMIDRLTDTLDFQGQALSLRAERQRLIASNIANADTPGYVSRDVDFAQALRQATGAIAPASRLATSQAGHIGAGEGSPASAATHLNFALASQTSLDR